MQSRVERIAGYDKKITQADIQRLESRDPNGDLHIARDILPSDFFKQLEAGKWFGIGQGSVLWKAWYIQKLNQIWVRYEEEKGEIETESAEALQSISPKETSPTAGRETIPSFFTRTLKLTSPRMQGPDVQLLQQKLTQLGFNTQGFDGIFWKNTQRALIAYQRQYLGQSGDGVMDLGWATQKSFETLSPISTTQNEGWSPEKIVPKWNTEIVSVSLNIKRALNEVWIQNSKIQERIETSLVSIRVGWGAGWTGVFIAPNMIVTAEHVIRDLITGDLKHIGKIRAADGKVYQVKKIFIDPSNNDIAYIQTIESSSNYLEYAPDSSRARSEGILLGFSWSRPRFYAPWITYETQATESLFERRDQWKYGETMFVDFPALKWDSGGPIVDKNGNILGIIVRSYQYWEKGQVWSIAEPVEDIIQPSKVIIS